SFFFSSRRRHTRFSRDWSSDVCSSDLEPKSALATRARAAFAKTQAEMQALTRPRDYRVVLREHRAQKLTGDALVALYTERLAARSEERRVGNRGRSLRWARHIKETVRQ